MSATQAKNGRSWPRLSGPHICAGAGKQALDLARKSLLSAADMRGGNLGAADINMVFDFLAASQDMFDVYRHNYEACGKIHRKQSFVGANKNFFAMSVLRFLCFDILRATFEPQIKRSDGNWEIEFLHAFSDYICRTANPEFENQLSAAYRSLAGTHGNAITAITIANDETIQEIIRQASAKFPTEHIDFVNFSNTINKALSDKYEVYGPSPIKVSEPVIEHFFEAMKDADKGNFFRKMVFN
ncbi:MAG: hypothetical protein ABJL55_00850 [Roseibium sp.]